MSTAELYETVSPEERGRVIAGRYEIVERIGEGAMGQVLRVRHRRLGKLFALKLMQASLVLDDEARALFDNEARVASSLCHPNIVSVVDFGEDPDWGLFIAMELIEGETLTTRIAASRKLPVEIACDVAIQLADALAHSGAQGVVHGDVKADNVVCVADDESGWHVELLDFGTARLASPSNAVEDIITGTPAYLAPERITGGPPRHSNDIYSVGVLLYEMLTGETPFRRSSAIEVLHAHLGDEPERVDAARGEVLDDALVAIVHRALEKDPARRYSTAEALRDDLVSYMAAIGARERARARRVGAEAVPRSEAATEAFDALGVAAAGLDVRGTIRVANAAFAALVGAADARAVEGHSIGATALAAVHPGIREDLRRVAMTGESVRRRAGLVHPGVRDVELLLIMTPTQGACGSCMVAVTEL